MSDIATRLKCALGDTGFTQKELAQMTGLTEVSISRYVNGNRVPKATTLARIDDALGVGMGYFFDSVDKDTNVPSTDYIDRQEAIDDLQGKDPSQIWDTADIEVWINSLPSAKPEITGKKVLAWLLAYHAKSFDLRGHYKANEVIGWLIHDISKDLLENDGGEQDG